MPHIEDEKLQKDQALFQNQITVGASEVSEGTIAFMHIYYFNMQKICFYFVLNMPRLFCREGQKKKTGQKIAYYFYFYFFYVKTL